MKTKWKTVGIEKMVVIIIIIAFTLIIILSLASIKKQKNVVIIKDRSFLEEILVDGDTVMFVCSVCLENREDSSVQISIIGELQEKMEDAELKEKNIAGKFESVDSESITLKPNTTLEHEKIVFQTKFSGKVKIKDRNLPEMQLIYIK